MCLPAVDGRDKRHCEGKHCHMAKLQNQDLPRASQGLVKTREQTYVCPFDQREWKNHIFFQENAISALQLKSVSAISWKTLEVPAYCMVPPQTPLVVFSSLSTPSIPGQTCPGILSFCSTGSLGKQPSHQKIHFCPAASARLECNLGLGKHGFTCFN